MYEHFSKTRNKNVQIIFVEQQVWLLELSSVSRPEMCECEDTQVSPIRNSLQLHLFSGSCNSPQLQQNLKLGYK